MSPLSLRRYRAERLLRGEFEALQGRVIAAVRARLRGCGVSLDAGELEACYAEAWQGLYTAILDGREIENPTGWLVLVSFRRAIEQQRAGIRVRRLGDPCARDAHGEPPETAAQERDLAAELDDRVRLRHLLEGLSARLSGREREAAVLCYLQGFTRAEAAARMGVSEARMRKLMEGRGPGRPGVAGKVGALVATIRDGDWCEEQGSLMRGLAFGILDPDGERYRLARVHRGECPACRAYVASLRGLAGALPPLLLPWGVGAGALAQLTEGAHGAAAVGGAGSAGAGAGAGLGRGVGGAIGASAGAGAGGAAGGGWLLAGGPLGAKLAVGCLLALGVGAGCVELGDGGQLHSRAPRGLASTRPRARSSPRARALAASFVPSTALSPAAPVPSHAPAPTVAGPRLTASARASREFGPEQPGSARTGAAATSSQLAHAAAAAGEGSGSPSSEAGAAPVSPSSGPGAGAPAQSTPSPAEREFSPG